MPSPRRSSKPEAEFDSGWASAGEIADGGRRRAASRRVSVVEDALARITARDPVLNSFTDVLAERAREARAARSMRRAPRSKTLGPARRRAVRGEEPVRREGAADPRGLEDQPRACRRRAHDQPLIERLEAAGAVLVGALNMGEYAYDFTGENVHDGNAHNPHDVTRMTGGSSSGSGGAVAGGLVPLSLGSDTNGSIRVPSSFCGLFGLKPTYGRLTRARSFPFVASLDHLGPLARSTRDLALAYDAMQGHDPEDPVCADRPVEPTLAEARARHQGPAHRGRGRIFPQRRVPGGLRRGGARRGGAAAPTPRSKSPRRSAPAPRPT